MWGWPRPPAHAKTWGLATLSPPLAQSSTSSMHKLLTHPPVSTIQPSTRPPIQSPPLTRLPVFVSTSLHPVHLTVRPPLLMTHPSSMHVRRTLAATSPLVLRGRKPTLPSMLRGDLVTARGNKGRHVNY